MARAGIMHPIIKRTVHRHMRSVFCTDGGTVLSNVDWNPDWLRRVREQFGPAARRRTARIKRELGWTSAAGRCVLRVCSVGLRHGRFAKSLAPEAEVSSSPAWPWQRG